MLTQKQYQVLELLTERPYGIAELQELIPGIRNEVSELINRSIVAQQYNRFALYHLTTPGLNLFKQIKRAV